MEYRNFARFCDEAGFSDLLSNRVAPLDDERALAEGLMVPVLEAIEAQDIYGRDDPELGLVGVEHSVENTAALNSFVNAARGEIEKGNGDDPLYRGGSGSVLTNVNIVQAVGDGGDGTSKIVHYKDGRVTAGFLTSEILTFYGELLNGCATTRERPEGEARLFLGLGTYEDLAHVAT